MPMTPQSQRLLLLVIVLFAIASSLALVFVAFWPHDETVFHNSPRLIAALKAYIHDKQSNGLPVAAEITPVELVSGHYLSADDTRQFAGRDVTFFTKLPQGVIARIAIAKGEDAYLLANGNIVRSNSISKSH